MGFDAVVLDAAQAEEAKMPMKPKTGVFPSASAEGSPTKARVHAPADDGAFIAALPAEARSIARATLRAGLKTLKSQMEKAASDMWSYLLDRAELVAMDNDGIERTYATDIQLALDYATLVDAGYELERFPKFRSRDVGFRMAFCSWDDPSSWPDRVDEEAQ